MASIYEKLPHFVLEKTWDKKTQLPKNYKLQSNNSRNKIKAKVHQDSGNLALSSRLTKQYPTLKKGLRRSILTFVTPLWSLRMCSRANTRLPGSRSCVCVFLASGYD